MQDWKRLVVAAVAGAALSLSALHTPLEAQGRGRGRSQNKVESAPAGKTEGTAKQESPRQIFGAKPTARVEEPAFARGYEAGRERGLADARDKQRYDPVGSREYRNGDLGYTASYGSRDAYKSNYRAGFRQGYEDGYRRR